MDSIDKIEIDTLRDFLIIEKINDSTILEGSNIFCGCCGKSIGKMKSNLTFPFIPNKFLDSLEDKSVIWMKLGLTHSACRHTMFPFQEYFDFISLENYKKIKGEVILKTQE